MKYKELDEVSRARAKKNLSDMGMDINKDLHTQAEEFVLCHQRERFCVGHSDFIPVELLLDPDLTDEKIDQWRKDNQK